ncbi:MAG: hypothetical protein ACI39C_07360 [Dietzia sp.]
MTAPDQERDGGPITPGTVCPHCGCCDVHEVRPPWHPGPYRLDVKRPQFNEHAFTYIRTCTSCGWEWGQR